MDIATLAVILRRNEIVLGRKRGGSKIGEGTINAPGGTQELGETVGECLAREVEEEIGVILDLAYVEKIAVITFFAGRIPYMEMHAYRTANFIGEPHATKSMIPDWYDKDDPPFAEMLESDPFWFPQIVRGEKFCANVYFLEKAKGFLHIQLFPYSDSE